MRSKHGKFLSLQYTMDWLTLLLFALILILLVARFWIRKHKNFPPGIFFRDGAEWREQRRFTLRHLRDFGYARHAMESIVHEAARVLLETLDMYMSCDQLTGVDVGSVFPLVSSNVVWQVMAGRSHLPSDVDFQKILANNFSFFSKGDPLSIIILYPLIQALYSKNSEFGKQIIAIREIQKYITITVNEHMDTFDENHMRDFIDSYIREMKSQTDNDGSFTKVQQKLRDEVYRVVGTERLPGVDDMPKLHYAQAVLNETLRHSGLLPFPVIRSTPTDNHILGYDVPKETLFLLNFWSMNMDPELWGDPRNFRPERFIAEDGTFQKKEFNLPFGLARTPKHTKHNAIYQSAVIQSQSPSDNQGIVWFTVFLVVTVVLLLLMFLTRKPKDFPPGPFSVPLLGSLPIIMMTKAETPHDVLWTLSRKYGPVMTIYLGPRPAIVVSGLKAVKNVLSRDDFAFRPNMVPAHSKGFGRRMGKRYDCAILGVFFTDGPEWREQRRFSLRNLRDFGYGRRSMETLIHEEARALISVVDQAISEPEFNILPLLPVTAINVLWTIMAGQRHDLDNHDFQKLTRSVLAFFRSANVTSPVGSSPLLQKIPIINASHKKRLAISDEIKQFIENTILEHEATFDENHMRDFMDVYIKEMREESHSSFSKTTSSTISYALRYMVQYPKVQDELRDELQRVVGTERLPGMDDVPKLHYTQAVVAETLRHSGLVPFAPPHTAQTDVDLMGYRIPKETFIMTSLWSVHMDPELWGDPKNFRPRMCLGEPLARYSTLLFLTALVQRFHFEPRGSPPSNEQQTGITTSPVPFRMTITRCCRARHKVKTHVQGSEKMDWFTVILVVTALMLLMFLTRRPKDFPPGPFRFPLLGNLPIILIYFMTKTESAHDIFWALSREYGPVMSLYLGRGPAVIVTGYKAVKNVLSRDDFAFRPTLIPGNANTKCFGRRKGVFFTDGPEWREQRRFSLRNLRDFGFGRRSMETLIHEEARALMSVVDKAISEPEFNILPLLPPEFNILPLLPVTAINVLWTIMAGQRHDLDNLDFQKLTTSVLAFFRSGTTINWSLQRIPLLNASHKKRLALADEISQFIENTIMEHEATFDENHMRDFMDVYIKEMRDESHSSFTNDSEFQKLTRSVLNFFRDGNPINPVLTSPFLQKIPIINAAYERQLACVKEIKEYIQKTIDEHVLTYDENYMRDFMDVFIREMREKPDSTFTGEQLCAVCIDLFNAGTETSSSTLAYALRYLVQFPRVQDKLRHELHNVIGTERLPDMDDLSKLHYSQAVIAETLRHSGLVPGTVPHAVRKDTEFMGYTIPKDTLVMVNLWSVHMDPKIWGDPENFRPERFIAQDGTFKKDEHLMLFGYGPVSFPLLGSIPALAMVHASTRQDKFWILSQKYGPVVGLYLGIQPAVLINGYHVIKQVLSREDFSDRPNFVPASMKSFGKNMGVFFTNGPFWREQRRFTLRHLRDFGFGRRSMVILIHEEARALINTINAAISDPDNDFDLLPLLPLLSINVLWTIMAGKRHDLDDSEFQKLTRSVLNFFRDGNPINPVRISPFLQKIPIINAAYKRQLACMKEIKEYIQKTIDEHVLTYDENYMRDFMDVFIREMREKPDSTFTGEQLCAVCIDLFNAGTETSSSTLAYALRYLVQFPRVQDKLRHELHNVIGTERLPDMDDLSKLHYSQAVIAETLRHSGLAPGTVPHAVRKDTELMGYTIPKDTLVMVNLWSVHMDPKIWGDPENFRPERFIAQDGTFKKDEHLMLFGYGMDFSTRFKLDLNMSTGPRMCLGEPLAWKSALLFLTSLVQHFRFEPRGPPPSNEQLSGFTTSPAPYRMTIKRVC
ncbi:hypothetical protein B566_EDAN003128 [Ephemera danica]|nr:hypothetical protein B566_EDAN003128 [Ephemera danica]